MRRLLPIARLRILLLPVHNMKIKTYKTVILFVVLYGFKIWSVGLRDELRQGGISEQDTKRISGLKRERTRRLLRKLLYNLYTSPNFVKMLEIRAHPDSY